MLISPFKALLCWLGCGLHVFLYKGTKCPKCAQGLILSGTCQERRPEVVWDVLGLVLLLVTEKPDSWGYARALSLLHERKRYMTLSS